MKYYSGAGFDCGGTSFLAWQKGKAKQIHLHWIPDDAEYARKGMCLYLQ